MIYDWVILSKSLLYTEKSITDVFLGLPKHTKTLIRTPIHMENRHGLVTEVGLVMGITVSHFKPEYNLVSN